MVSSLPVDYAHAATEFFGSEFSPDTQTGLVSSMAWCWLRRLRLFNFRPAQIKECPHDDRNHWPLRVRGLAATYASTSRTRSVSVELARHRWKAVLTG